MNSQEENPGRNSELFSGDEATRGRTLLPPGGGWDLLHHRPTDPRRLGLAQGVERWQIYFRSGGRISSAMTVTVPSVNF